MVQGLPHCVGGGIYHFLPVRHLSICVLAHIQIRHCSLPPGAPDLSQQLEESVAKPYITEFASGESRGVTIRRQLRHGVTFGDVGARKGRVDKVIVDAAQMDHYSTAPPATFQAARPVGRKNLSCGSAVNVV
jgi:hypothetical protein